MTMTTMLILSILLAASFVGVAIWRKRKLPVSISSLVYLFEGNYRMIWTVWMWAVALLTAPALIDAMPEDFKFVGFLTIASLVFTGAMPLFMEDNKKMHFFFAYTAGILSQLCVVMICPWWLGVWMVFAFLMGSIYVQPWGDIAKIVEHKGAFIAEMCCAASLWGCLIVN